MAMRCAFAEARTALRRIFSPKDVLQNATDATPLRSRGQERCFGSTTAFSLPSRLITHRYRLRPELEPAYELHRRRARLDEMLGTTCCLRIGWKENLSSCVLQHEIVANCVEQPTLHALLPFG